MAKLKQRVPSYTLLSFSYTFHSAFAHPNQLLEIIVFVQPKNKKTNQSACCVSQLKTGTIPQGFISICQSSGSSLTHPDTISPLYTHLLWYDQGTVEPGYNEGPRDWQNLFATTRFHYIEVLFDIFYYYWCKENRSSFGGPHYVKLHYIDVPLY